MNYQIEIIGEIPYKHRFVYDSIRFLTVIAESSIKGTPPGYAVVPVKFVDFLVDGQINANGHHFRSGDDSATIILHIAPLMDAEWFVEMVYHEIVHSLSSPAGDLRHEWENIPYKYKPHELYANWMVLKFKEEFVEEMTKF